MFHQQAKMFVTYIIESDSLKFNLFLLEIQEGTTFSETFNKIMETSIQDKWKGFLLQLREQY